MDDTLKNARAVHQGFINPFTISDDKFTETQTSNRFCGEKFILEEGHETLQGLALTG